MTEFITTISKASQEALSKKMPVATRKNANKPIEEHGLANQDSTSQEIKESHGEVSSPNTQVGLVSIETAPQAIIRSEVNFLVLPFFSLSRRDAYQRAKTEYHATVKRGDGKLDVSWKVLAQQEYGYPGPFDRQVHKVVEQIISELRPPLSNPIPLGSLYYIAKLLNLGTSGQAYRNIKRTMQRIVATTVESKGTFYQKERERWVKDTFHLYDRVVFAGEMLSSGEIADTNYLYLGSWYLENINSRYVKPLDYTYYRSLKSNIASRLYEMLGVKFYGLRKRPHIRFRYSTLCQILPLSRQRYFSNVKQNLNSAHQELVNTGFLSNLTWSDVPADDHDWYVTYWPGPRAKQEIQHFPRQLPLTAGSDKDIKAEADSASPNSSYFHEQPVATVVSAHLPTQRQATTSLRPKASKGNPAPKNLELTNPQKQTLKQLKKIGVGRVAAENLVRHSDPQAIRNWIRLIEGDKNVQDPPAYLVTALREKWQLPESFHRKVAERRETQRRELERHRRENCPKCEGRGVYYVNDRTVARCNHKVQNAKARPTGTKLEEQIIGETKAR